MDAQQQASIGGAFASATVTEVETCWQQDEQFSEYLREVYTWQNIEEQTAQHHMEIQRLKSAIDAGCMSPEPTIGWEAYLIQCMTQPNDHWERYCPAERAADRVHPERLGVARRTLLTSTKWLARETPFVALAIQQPHESRGTNSVGSPCRAGGAWTEWTKEDDINNDRRLRRTIQISAGFRSFRCHAT